jgi:hypothetical protein
MKILATFKSLHDRIYDAVIDAIRGLLGKSKPSEQPVRVRVDEERPPRRRR